MYTAFALALGKVLTGESSVTTVKSKYKSEDGTARFYRIESPKMLSSEEIVKGIEDLYAQYKKYDEDPKQSPKLFLQSKMERFDITSTPQESLLY